MDSPQPHAWQRCPGGGLTQTGAGCFSAVPPPPVSTLSVPVNDSPEIRVFLYHKVLFLVFFFSWMSFPAVAGHLMNHRITECLGLTGASVGHPAQPPAQAGSPRAGGTAPRPGGAGISPEKETPQPPWAAWARAPSPSEGRSSSSCSAGASSASVCAHCPLSCRWAPLERVWPHPPDTHPADIYGHF